MHCVPLKQWISHQFVWTPQITCNFWGHQLSYLKYANKQSVRDASLAMCFLTSTCSFHAQQLLDLKLWCILLAWVPLLWLPALGCVWLSMFGTHAIRPLLPCKWALFGHTFVALLARGNWASSPSHTASCHTFSPVIQPAVTHTFFTASAHCVWCCYVCDIPVLSAL